MREIKDPRIIREGNKFIATCKCGRASSFTTKNSALLMLERGTCRCCKKDYRHLTGDEQVFKRDSKWCCKCSGCGEIQSYTRKDHAKQSVAADWQCRKCRARQKKFTANQPVGWKARIYNKFRKAANSRGISWGLDIHTAWESYTGRCALTGWELNPEYGSSNSPSLDRINSCEGYTKENIQWVHPKVNLAKRNVPNDQFIEMCVCIAKHVK